MDNLDREPLIGRVGSTESSPCFVLPVQTRPVEGFLFGETMEFVEFPKIPRVSRECIITEKIDGTNASVWIGEDGEFRVAPL